jgi:hypothetical protein
MSRTIVRARWASSRELNQSGQSMVGRKKIYDGEILKERIEGRRAPPKPRGEPRKWSSCSLVSGNQEAREQAMGQSVVNGFAYVFRRNQERSAEKVSQPVFSLLGGSLLMR